MSLVTAERSVTEGSSSTGWKRPSDRSARDDEASRSRRRPFGVITINGRAFGSSACRRSRWKCCAAVVALTTRMFSWAASCRKRSRRALGSVAFVAVRQEQRQARGLAPLGEARDQELIDHDLRAVDEVAELRLPE